MGQEMPAILDGATIRDLSGHVDDITGAVLDDASLGKLRGIDPASLPEIDAGTRIGPCVGNVGKCVSVGLNYVDHAKETNSPIPTEPILFGKAVTSLCGPNDDVEKPRASTKMDWEIELAIIIGKRAKYVSEADAMDYVAGYAVFNDVSERDFQIGRPGGQWLKGKSHDTFGPLGPWMVTKDENRRSRQSQDEADGQRQDHAGRLDFDADLRGGPPGPSHQPVHDAGAGAT